MWLESLSECVKQCPGCFDDLPPELLQHGRFPRGEPQERRRYTTDLQLSTKFTPFYNGNPIID
jgi:hypothetical protein